MYKNLFLTVFYLVFFPQNAWEKAIEKDETEQDFINNFLFPIFGLIAVTTFVGGVWIAVNADIRMALKQTMVAVSALFGGFYLVSYLLNELFPTFGLTKNVTPARKFVGYSSVALYLLFFVMPLIPEFSIAWFFVIYTCWIVYVGSSAFLKVSEHKRMIFTVIASLLIVLVPLIIKTLLELLINILPA